MYLLYHEKPREIILFPNAKEPNFDGNWPHRYFPSYVMKNLQDYVGAFRLEDHDYRYVTPSGFTLWYHCELAGPGGISVMIFAPDEIPQEDIEAFKAHYSRLHDVVRYRVERIARVNEVLAPSLYETLSSLYDLLEICRFKCSPRDDIILNTGESNESAMKKAIQALKYFGIEA